MVEPIALDIRIKDLFFDREVVRRAVDRARRSALSRAGAFIRQTAKTSIRPRKGTSRPGDPPFSHEGSLRKLILFGYDPRTDSVVVGPVAFREAVAPNALEFGGDVEAPAYGAAWKRGMRSIHIRPRPFMAPAMEKELSTLTRMWSRSVRSS